MTTFESAHETGRCGACGHTQPARVVKRLTADVAVIRCRNCHVAAVHPMPTVEVIRAHYDQYYLTRSGDIQSRERLIALHGPVAEWLLTRLPSARQRRILDFGFGSGAFLIQLARRGQATFGADLSRQNVTQLGDYCTAHGLTMNLVDLSRDSLAAFDSTRFDLITLFQVIEHLTEPLAQIQRLAALETQGGLLYLECPNDVAVSAWLKRLTRVTPGRKLIWGSLKYPEHLHGFNRHAITRMLETAGYRLEACGDYAYRDGFHQVEAEVWWPRWRHNAQRFSLYGLSRSVIPLADRIMSRTFGSGSGLYALARKMS